MRQRIFSGAVLLVFLAAVVVFNQSVPIALNMALAVISALAVYELIKAMNLHKQYFIMIPSLLTAVLVSMTFNAFAVFTIYSVYIAVLFAGLIAKHNEISFKDIAVVLCMSILIPLALRSLVSLRGLSENHGMFYVLIAILAAWGADAGAYFAGTFFGKRKLCPEISPKKTVEGAIGGAIVNVAIMLACGALFTHGYYHGAIVANYWVLTLIGLMGGCVSILGDLSFSLIKRSCHIKDFGQVIPGHGGILDRFDSVIFTAPFVYVVVSLLPIVVS